MLQIFCSYCIYGRHRPGGKYFKTVREAVFRAPEPLPGREWVHGQAGPIVKARIHQLLVGIRRSDDGAIIGDKKIDNFVFRLQTLEARRSRS